MEAVLNILYIVSLLVMVAGAGVLVLDVIFSFLSDKCTEPITAEYVVNKKTGLLASNRESGLFVLSQPEFRYVYKNRKYRGRSANFFMKVFFKSICQFIIYFYNSIFDSNFHFLFSPFIFEC